MENIRITVSPPSWNTILGGCLSIHVIPNTVHEDFNVTEKLGSSMKFLIHFFEVHIIMNEKQPTDGHLLF